MKEYPWGKGTPKWTYDATANDSDKSFTVPTGKIWKILSLEACLKATATVGNRVLQISISDGTNAIYRFQNSTNITASQQGTVYMAANVTPGAVTKRGLEGAEPGVAQNTAVAVPSPDDMYLLAGYVVRVYDTAAVDASEDDLTVVLHYVESDA